MHINASGPLGAVIIMSITLKCRYFGGELGEVFHELTVRILVPVLEKGEHPFQELQAIIHLPGTSLRVALAASFWHSPSRFDVNAETFLRLT